MDNYKTIEQKLRNREDFRGNTMYGFRSGGTYYVFSYRTEIALETASGEIHLNPRKYSVTTSKHQNIIRRAWGVN